MLIGVFDSGIGGLTVLRELHAHWPGHSTIYLGDTARVPYGTKSRETVVRYARQISADLLERRIELLVVACNTASAYAVGELQDLPVPVVGVVEPGADAAIEALNARAANLPARIGVIGTAATVASGAYETALRARWQGPDALTVDSRACPLFVPLAEDGWEDSPVTREVARRYLEGWLPGQPDRPAAVVLGCTHYPVLKAALAEVLGAGVTLIDSAQTTARALVPHLEGRPDEAEPTHHLLVTDGAPGFQRIATRLLGGGERTLEVIDL